MILLLLLSSFFLLIIVIILYIKYRNIKYQRDIAIYVGYEISKQFEDLEVFIYMLHNVHESEKEQIINQAQWLLSQEAENTRRVQNQNLLESIAEVIGGIFR